MANALATELDAHPLPQACSLWLKCFKLSAYLTEMMLCDCKSVRSSVRK